MSCAEQGGHAAMAVSAAPTEGRSAFICDEVWCGLPRCIGGRRRNVIHRHAFATCRGSSLVSLSLLVEQARHQRMRAW